MATAGLPAAAAFWFLASVSDQACACWIAGKGREMRGSCQVGLPGQPSYTEHVERSRNHGGGRDAQPVEKQAAAKYKVIWKCGQEAEKKNIVITRKNSVVKPGRRKDTTKSRYTLKKLNCNEFNGLQEIFGWEKK